MLECVDAINLTAEAARREAAALVETLAIWRSAFQAADVLVGVDEVEGAVRVIMESCRTLIDQLSTHLAANP